MALQIKNSKTNHPIYIWDTQFIHSSYNPIKEAERFVEQLSFSKTLRYICFIAPFSGYCSKLLKAKFPNTKIIVIEFFNTIPLEKNNWDYAFYLENPKLSQKLYEIIGEENSLNTEIIVWPSSERLFPNEIKKTIALLTNFFHTARDVLGTRLYFTKKWNNNIFRNAALAKNLVEILPTKKAICIIASGPSLEQNISFLKSQKNKLFIIALSSALSFLALHDIEPDICFTSDGGFWAKIHLQKYAKNFPQTIFLAPLEAALPYSILENNFIHFIDYGDGLSHQISKTAAFKTSYAIRCGTVSGTALSFAQTMSDTIIFLGLDLSTNHAFPHSQPNALELFNAFFDSKLKPKTSRISKAFIESKGSLAVYEKWFENLKKTKEKIFRLKAKTYAFPNSFEHIQDVDEKFLIKLLEEKEESKKEQNFIKTKQIQSEKIKTYLQNNIHALSLLQFDTNNPLSMNNEAFFKTLDLKAYLDFQKEKNEKSFLELQKNSISLLKKYLCYFC